MSINCWFGVGSVWVRVSVLVRFLYRCRFGVSVGSVSVSVGCRLDFGVGSVSRGGRGPPPGAPEG